MPKSRAALPQTFRVLHVAWALPCAVVSMTLATSTGGHPPGLVFLPVAILVWAGGHACLWGVRRLARYGANRRGIGANTPLSITVALVASGLAAFSGLYLVLAALITGRGPSGTLQSAGLVTIWLTHLAAYVGLLLRTAWGRYTAAICGSGWLVALAAQLFDHLFYGGPTNLLQVAVAAAITVLLATLIYKLVLGSGEKTYTAPRATAEPSDTSKPNLL